MAATGQRMKSGIRLYVVRSLKTYRGVLFWRYLWAVQNHCCITLRKPRRPCGAFSALFISLSFAGFDRENYLSLGASLLGVTSLIFCAKGNPVGQLLMVIFSLLYALISYSFAYYGEMLTYLGMTAPMALVALVSWLRNPYKGNRAEVKVNRLGRRDTAFDAAAGGAGDGRLSISYLEDFRHR